jgi:hypothetical protein
MMYFAGLQDEFKAVKDELFQIAKNYASTFPTFYEGLQLLQASRMRPLKYENIMKLVYIMTCIPLNTACCERGFSIHTAVKTKIRSRMGVELLDALLRIKCGFPVELADPKHGTPEVCVVTAYV